jgi:hypothetical protein
MEVPRGNGGNGGNGGLLKEWRNGGNGGNGGMVCKNTCVGLACELNWDDERGGMAEWRNGGMAEWSNGGMATYLLHLWYTPTTTPTTPKPFNLL